MAVQRCTICHPGANVYLLPVLSVLLHIPVCEECTYLRVHACFLLGTGGGGGRRINCEAAAFYFEETRLILCVAALLATQ